MTLHGFHLLTVLAAAVASMLLGFLWYSPLLFARPWMLLMGYNPDDKAKTAEMQKGAGKLYGISFVASLVSAFVMAAGVVHLHLTSWSDGAHLGLAVWFGFVATVQLTGTLFSKQPVKLFLINTGYQLVCYLAMGVILVLWQ